MKRSPALHQARVGRWSPGELKAHLARIVDGIAARDGAASPLAVMLELLDGEMKTYLLLGRVGHLDSSSPDGKIAFAVIESEISEVGVRDALTRVVCGWVKSNDKVARPLRAARKSKRSSRVRRA